MIATTSVEEIRDLYVRIRDVTADFLRNPTVEGFPELMKVRSSMIASIASHKIPLKASCSDPVVAEIKGCIETILELDKRAARSADEMMSDIKSELSSLGKKGPAAKAYAANCR